MSDQTFHEGVKLGGLTTSTEIRILLCYLINNSKIPITRKQLEEVVLGEELANYFIMAESLMQLAEQKLVSETDDGYEITQAGKIVAQTLEDEVPRAVRELATYGVIRVQQYAAKFASNNCTIKKIENGYQLDCSIKDDAGDLFNMQLYMPNELTANAVYNKFIENGDEVYKLVLSALTGNRLIAEKALNKLDDNNK